MRYKFKSEITAWDFWKLSMYHTYHSLAGVCNIVFTGAMVVLMIRFWNETDDLRRLVMIFGCLLFTVVQPLSVYTRSKKQLRGLPKDLEIEFDEAGLHVTTGGQNADIRWNKIRSIVKEYNMIAIFSDARHGYMIAYRTLGEQKEEFLAFLESRMEHKK